MAACPTCPLWTTPVPNASAATIYAGWADDRFPYMSGVGAMDGRLIEYPYCGNQLHIRCLGCEREGCISGRRLASEFTEHLSHPVGRFISALRCSGCKGRRLLVHGRRDPHASGFQRSTQDDEWTISVRRLNSWLNEAGTDVWAFADIVRRVPSRVAFGAAEAAGAAHGA